METLLTLDDKIALTLLVVFVHFLLWLGERFRVNWGTFNFLCSLLIMLVFLVWFQDLQYLVNPLIK